jgi:hypothetical protein
MQSQIQSSTVSATGNITQSMNPLVNGTTGGNVSLDIEQNQGSAFGLATGLNNAKFTQTTNQTAIANAKNGKTVNQTQNAVDGDGTTGSPFSGIVGTINQDSKGLSTATVTQSETQCEDAANTSNSAALTGCSHTSDAVTGITLNQTQNGPVGLFTPPAKSTGRVPYYHKGNGKSLQTGAGPNIVDIFNLNQTSAQHADKAGPNTTVNQSNIMQGDCASSGNGTATGGTCTASQQATLNGTTSGTTSDGYAAGSISQLTIKCTNGHGSCTATPPPSPTLTATPPVDLNGDTTATSASFEFTDPAQTAHFDCTLDTDTVTPCGSPSINNDNLLDGTKSYSGLTLGPHTLSVTATDSSGNTSNQPPLATFAWTVVPPCTIGAGNSPLGYSSMPSDVVNCGPSSEGFEADSDNEFGDEVTLSTAGGTNLASVSVDFQSYGCSVSGTWQSGCVTNPGDTFTIPITATIYSVGAGDTVGPSIATSTVNPDIPYRPSADNTNCTGDDAGKWFDHIAAACRYSYPDVITFNTWTFPHGSTSFTNGEKVIWTVQFNTTHAGYVPIGESTACFSSAVGCGYDSLNVGTKTFTNAATGFTTAPYAGTDVDEDLAFRSYDSPGYSGPVVPLAAETGWTGFRPLGKIVLGP